MASWKNNFFIFILLLLTFILYYPAIFNDLTNWDDNEAIINNSSIRSLSWVNLQKIFSEPYFWNYQPLLNLSYAIEYYFFGLNPRLFHLDNILLFLINIILIYKFIHILSGKSEVAMIAAIFFAVHPTRVEPVAWATTRSYVLLLAFYLLSLIQYIKYIRLDSPNSIRHFLLSIFYFILACLCKSTAISLFLTLIFIDYLLRRPFNKKAILDKIPFFLLFLFFGLIAITSVKEIDVSASYSFLERLQYAAYSLFFYLGKFILPFPLSAMYPFPYISNSLPLYYWIFPIAFILLLFIIFYTGIFTRKIIFAFGFFLATVILVLQFFAVGGVFASDRYTFVPFIGLFYLTGEGYSSIINSKIAKSNGFRYLINFILCTIVVIFAYSSHNRIKVWKNSISLFTDVIEQYPLTSRAYNNRAIALTETGDLQGALKDFNAAIEIDPKYSGAYCGRVKLEIKLKHYEAALADIDKWLSIKPCADAYNDKSQVYFLTQNYIQALKDINLAIQDNYSTKYIFNRGVIHFSMKLYAKAREDFSMTISDSLTFAEAYYFRGNCNYKLNDLDGACLDWNKTALLGKNIAAGEIQNNCLGSVKNHLTPSNEINK